MAQSPKKDDSSKGKKQVFDVARPGSSVPSATSRPIIVGSGSIMKDPMVSKPDDKNDTDEEKKDSENIEVKRPSTGSNRVIQPLTEQEETDEKNKTSQTKNSGEDADKEASKEADISGGEPSLPFTDKTEQKTPTEKDEVATTEPAQKEDKPQSEARNDNAVVDAVLNQTADKKEAAAESNQPDKEKLQALIDEKKYFVKVSHSKKRRRVITALTLLSVALLAAFALFAAHEFELINIW